MDDEWHDTSLDDGEEEGAIGGDKAQGTFNVPDMAMGQVFPGESRVTSMDFHEEGELCVAANSDK